MQLRPIVDATEKIIEALTEERSSAPASATPGTGSPLPPSVQVYFADVCDARVKLRDRLVTEARGAGASVAERVPLPWDSEAHAARTRALVQQSQLTVHLLDRWPGREIQDVPEDHYPSRQLEIALSSPVPQILWLPAALASADVEDEDHRQLIQRIRSHDRGESRYELVEGEPTELSNYLRERLAELVAPLPQPGSAQSFLIDTHQKDQRYAFELAAYLATRNLEVDFNQESRDPAASLTQFEAAVRYVTNLILVCGSVTPDWVQQRIRKAVKIVAEQLAAEEQTLENIWLYRMPGPGGQGVLPRLPPLLNIVVLDNSASAAIDPAVAGRLLAGDPGGTTT